MKNKYDFNDKDMEVPEIVNQKCREAYDIIYKKCGQKNVNTQADSVSEYVFRDAEPKKKNPIFGIKKGLAVAACAALVSAGAIVPAVTEYIPSLKEAINSANQSEQEDSCDDGFTPALALSDDPAPIEECDEIEGKLKVAWDKVFCDGTSLGASLMLTPLDKECFTDTSTVYGDIKVTMDGTLVNNNENINQKMCFSKADDGNYHGFLFFETVDSSKTNLMLQIADIHGENDLYQKYVKDDADNYCYMPATTFKGEDEPVITLCYEVTPDYSYNSEYTVNETIDDYTLKSVKVTPFGMTVYMQGMKEQEYLVCFDKDGNGISGTYRIGDNLNRTSFELPEGSPDTLVFEVCNPKSENFNTGIKFEVNIEKGFKYAFINEFNKSVNFEEIDYDSVVYDPPMEEADKYVDEEATRILKLQCDRIKKNIIPRPAGEAVPTGDGNLDKGCYYWTFKNCETVPIDDYTDELWERWGLNIYNDNFGSLDGAVLMLVTCDIENTWDTASTLCCPGPYLMAKNIFDDPENNNDSPYSRINEYHYVSYKENSGKAGYMYDFAPHEKKTITFGYVVPEEYAETGYYAYLNSFGYHGSDDEFGDIINGYANLCEIK